LNYTKYYTPKNIAELLVNLIDIKIPKKAIDICCGSCNLLNALRKRYSNVKLIGVDIIPQNNKNVKCIHSDGREYAISQKEKYKLVLANPPFSYLNTKDEYLSLYKGIFSSYHTSRLENEMLLANLYLLKKNGLLIIILPNTFVEAENNNEIRILLAKNFNIKKIIKLPNNTFGSTGIKSYALFISKKNVNHKITKFYEIIASDDILSLSNGKIIKQENMCKGQWFYSAKKDYPGVNLKRGNISSQMFTNDGLLVLHTSRSNENWTPSERFIEKKPKNPVFVEKGDILISRVGKSAGQWTIYDGHKTLISDCLFCLKDPCGIIYEKIKGRKYNNIIRGVAVQYITQNDFISWI
jgi:type I restriction-modification system DNA methylase subunit